MGDDLTIEKEKRRKRWKRCQYDGAANMIKTLKDFCLIQMKRKKECFYNLHALLWALLFFANRSSVVLADYW